MTLPFAGVGNTPMVSLYDDDLSNIELFAKLEFYNSTGSVKDRAAHYIIQKLFTTKQINSETTIIESSSGNLTFLLSTKC
jgi:cysteine synthase A